MNLRVLLPWLTLLDLNSLLSYVNKVPKRLQCSRQYQPGRRALMNLCPSDFHSSRMEWAELELANGLPCVSVSPSFGRRWTCQHHYLEFEICIPSGITVLVQENPKHHQSQSSSSGFAFERENHIDLVSDSGPFSGLARLYCGSAAFQKCVLIFWRCDYAHFPVPLLKSHALQPF